MASYKDLFTRQECNKPEKAYITKDHWVEYLGYDADEVQDAEVQLSRRVIRGEITEKEFGQMLTAAACVGWSFDEPFTQEAILELLKESPTVKKSLDREIGKRADFTKRLKAASSNTQKPTSGSAKKGKARKG